MKALSLARIEPQAVLVAGRATEAAVSVLRVQLTSAGFVESWY
jgi:hypothetical protein